MVEKFVSIGQIEVAVKEGILTTIGLGSCVGVAIFDRERAVGGLAHVFLPRRNGKVTQQPGKFADTAIPALVRAVVAAGGRKAALQAKIAGGAHVFSQDTGTVLDIGRQNVAAVREHLKQAGIPLRGEDVEGDYGRKMSLYVHTGVVIVQAIGRPPRQI